LAITPQYLRDNRISPSIFEPKLTPKEQAMLNNLSTKNRLNFLCKLATQSQKCQRIFKSLVASRQREQERFKNKVPFAIFDSITPNNLLMTCLTDEERAFVFSDQDDLACRHRLLKVVEAFNNID
jgi:hypothetical protein